jgi:hypothetical protein
MSTLASCNITLSLTNKPQLVRRGPSLAVVEGMRGNGATHRFGSQPDDSGARRAVNTSVPLIPNHGGTQ